MNPSNTRDLVIWRLTDGKPGHEKQTLGLVNAISKLSSVDCYDIAVGPSVLTWVNYLASIWPEGNHLPLPDLIVGAGHHTHIHMLAAKRAYGGKTVVLMRPSVSARLYDYALVPEHDAYRGQGNVIETRGVLNPMQASGSHDESRVLLLIGGPSKHYAWDNQKVISQLQLLIAQQPHKQFILTTSRRTPADFIKALDQAHLPRLSFVPASETPSGWVEDQLSKVGSAWITEDSVSMVYEALSAQVAVGLINVQKMRENRVANGVAKLVNKQMVVRFDVHGAYQEAMHALVGFQEADRCASQLLAGLSDTDTFLPQPQSV